MQINLRDTATLASKLTPKRVANATSIWSSYHLSRMRKTPQISGMPISMAIEPTTACNLRCPECPSGLKSFSRPTGRLSTELFEKIIKEVSEHLIYLTFYFQGEPYLNPEFLKMVRIASQHDIYTTTSTNAHFLDSNTAKQTVQSGLNRLIISIDGSTQETYESYRKEGKLDKVLEGTSNIIQWRNKLKRSDLQVVWQFLVVKPNEHQIPEIKEMAKSHGVDKVAFKTAQLYDYEYGNELMPDSDRYSRYRQNKDGTYSIKSKLEDKCWKMWNSCVITWDGQIIPCCFDKDAKHSFGNVEDQSFRDIWFSKPYQHFRQSLLNGRSEIEICKNCTEGLKVWA